MFLLVGATPAIGAPGDVVSLDFDELPSSSGEPVATTLSTGTAVVVAQMVTRDGGQGFAAEGHSGTALRLPAYSSSTAESRAVLRLNNATSIDGLSPGTANFAFGATAKLDAASQGTKVDNGNNLLQRGLQADAAQYKLDLDGRYPGCTVKGSLGKVSVRIREAVSPDDWYSLLCARSESTITLTVDHHYDDGTTVRRVKSATGLIGDVTMANSTMPLSVGGKLAANGVISVASTDQFNGLIDDVFLREMDVIQEEPTTP